MRHQSANQFGESSQAQHYARFLVGPPFQAPSLGGGADVKI